MGSGKGKARRAQTATYTPDQATATRSVLDGVEAANTGPFRMRTVKPHLFEVFNRNGKGTHEYFGAREHKGDDGARNAARARAKELNELHVAAAAEHEEKLQRQREVQGELQRVERVDF